MAFKLEKIVQYYPKGKKQANERKGLKIPIPTDIATNLNWKMGTPVLVIERENFLIVRTVDSTFAGERAMEELALIGDLQRFMPKARSGGPSRRPTPSEQGELLSA